MGPNRPTEKGTRGSRHAPPTNAFKPGGPGGPGRAAVSPEFRELLARDSPEHYRKAVELTEKAEDAGDLKTALHGRLALLKKTVPDATELVISMPDGLSVRSITIDPRKLTPAQLAAVHAAVAVAKSE